MTTPRELARRVRQLEESAGSGSLTPLEHLELDRLEADYRARFPSDDVDAWSERELDDYLLARPARPPGAWTSSVTELCRPTNRSSCAPTRSRSRR